MVAFLRHVVEICPLQFAWSRRVEQQATYVEIVVVWDGGQPEQSVDGLDLAVVIDGHEPGFHERRVGCEAGVERTSRYAKNVGQEIVCDVEKFSDAIATTGFKNRVNQRLDNRLRMVAQHNFQRRDVFRRKVHLPAELPNPLRRAVLLRIFAGCRILVLKGLPQVVPFPCGKFLSVAFPRPTLI